MLSSNNIFAALQTKKKKASGKSKDSDKKKDAEPPVNKHAELEKAIFSAPAAAMSSAWADESEEEDMHPAHLEADGWNEAKGYPATARGSQHHLAEPEPEPESESEDDEADDHLVDIEAELGIELSKSDDEEEEEEGGHHHHHSHVKERPAPTAPHGVTHVAPQPQISKKELKKKELEDLDAVLAELGLEAPPPAPAEAEAPAAAAASASAKAAKRKAKKEKQAEAPAAAAAAGNGASSTESSNRENKEPGDEAQSADGGEELDAEAIKARKAALAKKKAAGKKPSSATAAAIAAAAEAKAKAAKKAGKKDTSHYNQAPTR